MVIIGSTQISLFVNLSASSVRNILMDHVFSDQLISIGIQLIETPHSTIKITRIVYIIFAKIRILIIAYERKLFYCTLGSKCFC